MPSAIHRQAFPSVLFLFLTVLVYLFSIALVYSSLPTAFPELSTAITYDLVLTAPLFYYLAIRRTGITRLSVLAIAFFGIALATWLLPEGHRGHLEFITYGVLPFVEVAIFGIVGYKAVVLIHRIRKETKETGDVFVVLRSTMFSMFGESLFTRALAYEMSVVYYALTPVFRPDSSEATFSYHKTRGTNAIYAVIVFLVVAETIVLHFVISIWSGIAAWIVTAFSLYFLLFILAQVRASIIRPVRLKDDTLLIRCGLMCDAKIPLSAIEMVREIAPGEPVDYDHEAAFLRGFERHNLLLELSEELESYGPYGFRTRFRTLALYIDESDGFRDTVLKHDS